MIIVRGVGGGGGNYSEYWGRSLTLHLLPHTPHATNASIKYSPHPSHHSPPPPVHTRQLSIIDIYGVFYMASGCHTCYTLVLTVMPYAVEVHVHVHATRKPSPPISVSYCFFSSSITSHPPSLLPPSLSLGEEEHLC